MSVPKRRPGKTIPPKPEFEGFPLNLGGDLSESEQIPAQTLAVSEVSSSRSILNTSIHRHVAKVIPKTLVAVLHRALVRSWTSRR